jgi:uncharacterized protein
MPHTQPFQLPAKAVVGMVHLAALPGTPRSPQGPAGRHSLSKIIDQACRDAAALIQGGVDALLVENMHDRPYLNGAVGPEIVASMTACCLALKNSGLLPASLPVGIQVLAAANQAALAIAQAAGLQFIRAEGFVFAHVADEGLIQAQAAELARYRRSIGAEHIALYCDIKKKHASHALTADVDLAETAQAAEFFLADGLIVTGTRTAVPPAAAELRSVKTACPQLPLLVGSGVTTANIREFLSIADAVIAGSSVKEQGDWRNPVDAAAVAALVAAK